EPPEVVQVPATSSNITLTISKSRLLWVLTIGIGTLVMISVIVWFYGLTGGVSSIVQLASPDSEHREGMVFLPMILDHLSTGGSNSSSEQFEAYPAPTPLDVPEQVEAYPGPVHPDALREAQATPGGLIETEILTGHEGFVFDVAFSSDGQFLASSGVDPFINIWQVENGELLGSLGPHGGSVDTLSFSSDGQLLVSAGVDSTIKMWRLRDGHMLRNDPAHEGDWIQQVLFNPNNELLASISNAEPANDTTSFSFERSTQVALWRVEDGTLLRWFETPDPESGEPFSEYQFQLPNTVRYIAFSPDGRLLAGGQMDGSIAVWRVVDGVLLHNLDTQDAPINSLAFSPDNQTLVSGGDNRIQMWDVENGDLLQDVSVDTLIEYIVFSPDTTLFAALKDTTIYVGQTDSGSIITALEGHRWPLTSLAFSPDNHTLASGSTDMTVRLWDIQPLLPE
ncbi:MAG: WD40 repeat domain-containing protein, partial [Chloroflexota bacterium]